MSGLIGIILCLIVLISCIDASKEDDILEQNQASSRFSSPVTWISECRGNNGLTGSCMTRSDCTNRGGSPSGECASMLGVCCTATLGCGQSTRLKRVLLSHGVEPKSPCFYSLFPTSNLVCQLRIDFDQFQLAPPSLVRNWYGGDTLQCVDDSFEVNGIRLCGVNSGQHIYVPFNSNTIIGIRFTLANRLAHPDLPLPNWRIRITQLECPLNPTRLQRSLDQKVEHVGRIFNSPRLDIDDAFLVAPHGCLQYFPKPHGVFESFNFNNGKGPYIGNMRYSICFRRNIGDSQLRLTAQTFILPRTPIHPEQNKGYEEACYSSIRTPGRPEDYLFVSEAIRAEEPMIRASRFCGQGIHGTTIIASQPGPFAIHFNADEVYEPPIGGINPDNLETGFRFNYQII